MLLITNFDNQPARRLSEGNERSFPPQVLEVIV